MAGEGLDRALQGRGVAAVQHRLGKRALVLRDRWVALQLLGIDDGEVETRLDAVVKEDGVHHFASGNGEAEAHVADAEHRLAARKLCFDETYGLDGRNRATRVRRVARGAGEDERVEVEVLFRDAVLAGQEVAAAHRDRELVLRLDRLPALVDAPDDEGGTETPRERDHACKALLAVLEIDRIDDRLALRVRQRRGDRLLVGRVDHQGRADLLDQHFQEPPQVLHLVPVGLLGGDVDHVRAALHLGPGDLRRIVPLFLRNQVPELLGAEDVGALAYDGWTDLVGDLQRVDPGQRAAPLGGRFARPQARRDLHQLADVRVVRPAAAAEEVQPAVLAEALQRPREHLRRLEIAAVLVGKAGIRDAGDARTQNPRERADVIGHELRTGGAVEAEVQEVEVLERDRQRLDGLAREHRPHRLDRPANGDGKLLLARQRSLHALDPEQRRLDVARVLRGLDEEVVDAAVVQPARLRFVGGDELFEGDASGDRDRLGGRAHRSGDETRLFGEPGRFLPGEHRGNPVDLDRPILEPIFGEHDGRTAEGIGLEDVRPRFEVAAMDPADRVGPGQVQVLVAAFQLGATEVLGGKAQVLERRAHRAVEDEDALVEMLLQQLNAVAPAHSGTSAQRRNGRNGELDVGRISVLIDPKPSASSIAPRSLGSNPSQRWPSRSRTHSSLWGTSSSTSKRPPFFKSLRAFARTRRGSSRKWRLWDATTRSKRRRVAKSWRSAATNSTFPASSRPARSRAAASASGFRSIASTLRAHRAISTLSDPVPQPRSATSQRGKRRPRARDQSRKDCPGSSRRSLRAWRSSRWRSRSRRRARSPSLSVRSSVATRMSGQRGSSGRRSRA